MRLVWVITLCATQYMILAHALTEELIIHPIKDDTKYLAHFQFTANSQSDRLSFPKSIQHAIQQFHVKHLALTLTRGHWSAQRSPPPPWLSLPPSGLELRVTFINQSTESHPTPDNDRYKYLFQALTQALSGVTASAVPALAQHGILSFPKILWFGPSIASSSFVPGYHQIHAVLPQETPCTQSMVAFINLLPCRAQHGIAKYLNPDILANTPWHSLQLTIDAHALEHNTGGDQSSPRDVFTIDMQVSMAAALDGALSPIEDSVRSNNEYIPCRHVEESTIILHQDMLSFRERKTDDAIKKKAAFDWVPSHCHHVDVTSTGYIVCNLLSSQPAVNHHHAAHTDTTWWSMQTSSSITPSGIEFTNNNPLLEEYKLTINAMKYRAAASDVPLNSAAEKQNASTATSVKNSGTGALVHIMQAIPWELAPQFHTLQLHINNKRIFPGEDSRNTKSNALLWKVIQPSIPRQQSSLIEFLLQIDNDANKIEMSMNIKKQFLTIFDFPPDASRGIDIPGASITLVPRSQGEQLARKPFDRLATKVAASRLEERLDAAQHHPLDCATNKVSFPATYGIYSDSIMHQWSPLLLVNLPIPDASMPFNVVCFTSTAVALACSSLLNALLTTQTTSSPQTDGDRDGASVKRAMRGRALRLVVVLVASGGLAVYLDRDVQRKAESVVNSLLGMVF